MKRIFLALFLLSWTLGAASQNVALGEKTPDLKVKSWLDDRMPVPGTGHVIVGNAKTRRVSVCNALDCLLVDGDRMKDLPALCAPLQESNVIIQF